MNTIYCTTSQGTLVAVPETEVRFSPAVYGIMIESGRVMLQKHLESGLWHPPGGILLDGQTPERGVRAYFRTATGFLPDLTSLLYIEEQYRLDEQGGAWALSIFYYGLQRAVGSPVGLAGVAESQQPEWVPVQTLSREKMHFGYPAVMAGVRRQQNKRKVAM